MEKKKYKVLKPIALDGRKEPGDIVELTDEEAQAFSKEDLEAVAEDEKVDSTEQKEKNEESENQEAKDSEESDS